MAEGARNRTRRAKPVSSVGLAPAGRPFDCLPRQALRTGLARVRRLGSPPAALRLEQQCDDDDDDDQRAEAQGDVAAHGVLRWLRRCNAFAVGVFRGDERWVTPFNAACGVAQDKLALRARREDAKKKVLFAQRRRGAEGAEPFNSVCAGLGELPRDCGSAARSLRLRASA
jgi:hypothetical protein